MNENKINDEQKNIEELRELINNNLNEINDLKNQLAQLRLEMYQYGLKNTLKRILKKFSPFRIVNKLFPLNSRRRMIIRMAYYTMLHPIRFNKLFFNIKKGKIKFGNHMADIMYLKCGELNFKEEEKPTVSIVIPVYNQLVYTYKCLKSILENTKDVTYEIIIADDVSFDGTRCLNSYVKGINIVRNKENKGFLQNCNNATKYARGKYILFLNNDTQVKPKWLSSLVELIESDKSIGMVGSKLIYPNGILQEAGGIIWNDGSGCNYGKFDDPNKPEYNYIREVDYISGAAIMLSKELWEDIGGFDSRYEPAYCEDSDLAFEVRKKGLKVVYQPKSVVVHYEGISNGTDVTSNVGLKHYQVKNNIKLKEKWEEELKLLPSNKTNKLNITCRDRIHNKKVVLFVDHYVPEYDKDAGSRTTFQYLKMLVEKGYVVKFLGDNFYNKEPYTSTLQQMGIEVLYGIDYKNSILDWIMENKENIDIAYLNRPHITKKYIDFIKNNTDIKIIYYGHDLHFLREQREFELTGDEIHKNNSELWKKEELEIMKKSDHVYYPSYIEKDIINEIDKNINVKAINAYVFDNVEKEDYSYEKREGILFVGGFAHRPNVDGILWFVKNIYPLITKIKKIPLYIVGSNPTNEIKKLDGNGIIVKGFVSDEELEELYKNCKLVIAPLRYGAGIKGKVIEAMSKGIPIVTTTIGAEGIANAQDIISITDDEKEFAKNVLNLYEDKDKLLKISDDMKKYIKENYNSEAAWNIIKEDFKKKRSTLIITPDGYGSKGDEALIRGVLNIINPYSSKLITQRKDLWTNHLDDLKEKILEEYYELKDFSKSIVGEDRLIILGADVMDGTHGIESSICRLEAAKKMAEKKGQVYIFCSFRKTASEEIINYIKDLPNTIKFFLRDEISYENFKTLTGKECEYFPDMAYFVEPNDKTKVQKEINTLKDLKNKGFNLIGLNFSETSFRSFYNEYTMENRKKYVKEVIEKIYTKIKKPYFVLLSHDSRHWENYYSDSDYQEIASKILEEKNINNYLVINPDLYHSDLLNILDNMDTVVTGRMHLSIATFRCNTIPIIYTGSGKKTSFSMNDKMKGMFINRIKDANYVVNNLEDFEKALVELLNNETKLNELKQNNIEAIKKDEIKLIELKNTIEI